MTPLKKQKRKTGRLDPDYILPCDVHLTPATTITKGCKLSTLMAAFKVRESPDWIATKARELGYKFGKAKQ